MTVYAETMTEGGVFHGDPSLSDLSEYAKELFSEACNLVRSREPLPEMEQRIFEDHAAQFASDFQKILKTKNKKVQQAALGMAIAGMSLGFLHSGRPQILREMKGDFRDESIKRMHFGRSRPDIQKIIDRLADEQTHIDKRLIGHPYKIAGIIYPPFMDEVGTKVPKSWKVDPNKKFEAEMARITKNIAERLRKPANDIDG
jgi:hypothetical protein